MTPEGVMSWVDGRDRVELIRFIGKRADFIAERRTKKKGEHAATVLINGDGFDDAQMQAIQAELRRDCQRDFGALGVLVVPYMALSAAGVSIESIKRIAVTRDGGENVNVDVPGPPAEVIEAQAKLAIESVSEMKRKENYWQSSWRPYEAEVRKRAHQFQIRVVKSYGDPTFQHQIWRQPLDGTPQWQNISQNAKSKRWTTTEWRHRLGASVFSALDSGGVRHRYVSAFDMQEQPPLYFLAQLPDEGKVHTFDEAIDLLAPPIVHQARSEMKQVFRQGDVFFVETTLGNQDIKARNGKVFKGEAESGRPRRGRNIYSTGHIATQVAVMPNGVTLASGTVEHYPAFTEPGRRPEHRALPLTPDKWFLCIRNTVPRATTDSPGLGTQAQVDGQVLLDERSDVDGTIAA
jgi:hypothetical protein